MNSDEIGSVRGVVSSSGVLGASTSYDAWGNPETIGGLSTHSPFGYSGGYTDATQLVYLVNRFLDTSVGQFISADPIVVSTGQAYSYAADNPVNGTDPLGLLGLSVLSFVRTVWNAPTTIFNAVVKFNRNHFWNAGNGVCPTLMGGLAPGSTPEEAIAELSKINIKVPDPNGDANVYDAAGNPDNALGGNMSRADWHQPFKGFEEPTVGFEFEGG